MRCGTRGRGQVKLPAQNNDCLTAYITDADIYVGHKPSLIIWQPGRPTPADNQCRRPMARNALDAALPGLGRIVRGQQSMPAQSSYMAAGHVRIPVTGNARSEERRVGKE